MYCNSKILVFITEEVWPQSREDVILTCSYHRQLVIISELVGFGQGIPLGCKGFKENIICWSDMDLLKVFHQMKFNGDIVMTVFLQWQKHTEL